MQLRGPVSSCFSFTVGDSPPNSVIADARPGGLCAEIVRQPEHEAFELFDNEFHFHLGGVILALNVAEAHR
jgi:hypothetical protein